MPDILKEPILNLLSISIITAVLLYICKNTSQAKPLRLLCSLFALLAIFNMISPLIITVTDIAFDTDDSPGLPTESNDEILIEESAKYISIYTKDLIISRFNIEESAISVFVTLICNDEGEISIKNTTLEINSDIDVDSNQVADLVSNTLFCECIILKKE